jgi:hypothetical protein
MNLQPGGWARNQQLADKNKLVTECYTGLWTWMDSLEWPGQQKMDMRFGTWNVRSLHRAGSLKMVASKSAKYNTDLVAVQIVKWNKVAFDHLID